MNTETPTISPLAAALAAAQLEMTDPPRTKTMRVPGRPERKYAALDDLLKTVRPVLGRHGLAITQLIEQVDGRSYVVTQLRHGGGEVLQSRWELTQKGSPQDRGSDLTYGRRYSLEALVGCAATEDDDAESISRPEPQAEQVKARPRGKNREISTEPLPEDQKLADEVFAAREKAEAERKAKHHPSWDGDRASYSAAVSGLGMNVDLAAELAEHRGHPRPSAMSPVVRAAYVRWLASNEGKLAFEGFKAERLARETA
jgi:hypothetical protein